MTQADVAERIGIVTEVYGRLERASMLPSVPTLRELCRVLCLDANEVLGLPPLSSREESDVRPTISVDDPPLVRRAVRGIRRLKERSHLRVVLGVATTLAQAERLLARAKAEQKKKKHE